jgi:arylsulfatase A-like enzyme
MGSMVGAVCLPSRTMLMTGRSLFQIPKLGKDAKLDAKFPMIPTSFNQAGYVTWRTGKKGNTFAPANDAFQTNIYDENRTDTSTQVYADRVIAFLNKQTKDKPFFAYVGFPHPHDPKNAPEKYRAMYPVDKMPLPKNFMKEHPFDNGELMIRDEKLASFPRTEKEMRQHLSDYYAVVTYMDEHIGRILETLEKKGLAKNTIVVFSSDQGLAVGGMHGLMGKQNLYEHNKPPLIFHGPNIPKGKSDALVYLFDLFPTFCELSGIEIPKGIDGESLCPIIKGTKARIRDYSFGAYRDCQRMVRDERWKLMKYDASGVKNVQLFDLQNDPDEIKNLASDPKHEEQLRRMEKLLVTAQQWAKDPLGKNDK